MQTNTIYVEPFKHLPPQIHHQKMLYFLHVDYYNCLLHADCRTLNMTFEQQHSCSCLWNMVVMKSSHIWSSVEPQKEQVTHHQVALLATNYHHLQSISDSLSLESELNKRIGKAATTMARLKKRVWTNSKITTNTKIQVYSACVVSTLLYASEAWATRARQEHKLNAFHMRCLRHILGIKWQDKVPNTTVLERSGMPSMYCLLKQRRMRWLGHVSRMQDGRIPKDLLYGELADGDRPRGRPQLRYKDVCKRDMKALSINIDTWETLSSERSVWKHTVHTGLSDYETSLQGKLEEKRRTRNEARMRDKSPSTFMCTHCQKDCHSRIGLHSQTRRCIRATVCRP